MGIEQNPAGVLPKPHKFFERFLNNDLEKLSVELQERYDSIKNATLRGVTPVTDTDIWKESNSISTMKWQQYNVFQFHVPEIRKLYDEVSSMIHEACDYYGIDFKEQNYMLQGWFNINESGNGKLDWHDHGPAGAPFFHGYYCVKAEPSETHYMIFNRERKININKDNRAVVSEMGHPHAMGDWDWDGPRITIAYDVIPLSVLSGNKEIPEQHWIPLS
jgi:hypothetical protein